MYFYWTLSFIFDHNSSCSLCRCMASANGNVARFEWWSLFNGRCLLKSTRCGRRHKNDYEELRSSLHNQQVRFRKHLSSKSTTQKSLNAIDFYRAPFGLFYHAAWFTQPHHKEGFIKFLDTINAMNDVWIVTNWQALQWVRDPTPLSRINTFQPFYCNYQDRPKRCNNPKVCNLWHKSGVRYMRTCQPCPEIYPWTGKSGIRSSRVDHDIEE